MISNEAAAALIEVTYVYLNAGRRPPDHLLADLSDCARCDTIAHTLRNGAQRALRQAGW